MNHLPQIIAIAWLAGTTLSSIAAAAWPGRRQFLILTPRAQRVSAFAFAAAALSEASLLIWGGFFKGML